MGHNYSPSEVKLCYIFQFSDHTVIQLVNSSCCIFQFNDHTVIHLMKSGCCIFQFSDHTVIHLVKSGCCIFQFNDHTVIHLMKSGCCIFQFSDHTVLVDMDTIIHLVKGPARRFHVYIYRLDRSEEGSGKRKSAGRIRDTEAANNNVVTEQFTSVRHRPRTVRSNSSIR